MEKAECQQAPICARCPHGPTLQFVSLCTERQPVRNSRDSPNLRCLDRCHGVRSHGKSPPQSWRKRIVIQESEFDPWVYIRVLKPTWFMQVCLGKPSNEIGKGRHWTQVFFCRCASNGQDSPKASPRATFKWKNLVEQLNLLSQWMKWGESWMPPGANICHYVPTWANIAVCQLCKERQPLWNSHDSLNLTCLDQCHGVCSYDKNPFQGWCKWSVIQSTVWVWSMSLHPCFRRRWFLQVCLGKPSQGNRPL